MPQPPIPITNQACEGMQAYICWNNKKAILTSTTVNSNPHRSVRLLCPMVCGPCKLMKMELKRIKDKLNGLGSGSGAATNEDDDSTAAIRDDEYILSTLA